MAEGESEEKRVSKPLSTNKLIVAGFACFLAYVVLFALNAARIQFGVFPEFFPIFAVPLILESPMFSVMPFFAFFAVFFLVDWINKEFKTGLALHPIFLAVFFALSMAAYYVALYWYIANFASLQNIPMSLEMVNFWAKLNNSAFMLFIWGGMFGWIARYAVERVNL